MTRLFCQPEIHLNVPSSSWRQFQKIKSRHKSVVYRFNEKGWLPCHRAKTVLVILIGIAINLLMNIENAIDSMVDIERIDDSHLICKRISLVNDEGKHTAMFYGGGDIDERQFLLFGH